MSDRFPSLEEIDGGETEARGDNLIGGSTDTGDFLSRERAALGDDADQFSTSADRAPAVTMEDGDDDLLGGGDGPKMNGDQQDFNDFESSFPPVDTRKERMAPGGTITGSRSPFLPGAINSTSSFAPPPPEDEPAVIKEWRERRDLATASREQASSDRKDETIAAARTAIDEFYENYNKKRDRGVAQTRKEAEEFLKKREDTTAGGTSWERIAKLVELKGPKSGGAGAAAGKDRFKQLLLTLQKDENAPGAKGY